MHKSRLGVIVIDCKADALDEAERFWSRALGWSTQRPNDLPTENYVKFETPEGDVDVLLQRVDHPSRVHIDIETDDIEAEAQRLEALGARKVKRLPGWWVMEAPTGHRFCVVGPQRSNFEDDANQWD